MYKKILLLAVILSGYLMLMAGCEPDLNTTPVLPGEIAVLVITFNPDPVYEGYGNKYRFTVIIEEVNGVGARINSIKIEHVDSSGYVLTTESYDEYDVVQTFGTSQIEAYGRLMANVELEDCYNCALESWLVRANDDRGNHVEYSGTVELVSR